jgi:hypothetical protein
LGRKKRCWVFGVRALGGVKSSFFNYHSLDVAAVPRGMEGMGRPLRVEWANAFFHLVWRSGDRRLREVGEYFGVGPTGVAVASRRGDAHLKTNRRPAERVRGVSEYLTPNMAVRVGEAARGALAAAEGGGAWPAGGAGTGTCPYEAPAVQEWTTFGKCGVCA